eukprot:744017-Amphidinium_carterae.1
MRDGNHILPSGVERMQGARASVENNSGVSDQEVSSCILQALFCEEGSTIHMQIWSNGPVDMQAFANRVSDAIATRPLSALGMNQEVGRSLVRASLTSRVPNSDSLARLNDSQRDMLHTWITAYSATSAAVRSATDGDALQKINLVAPEPPPSMSSTVLHSVCSRALHVGEPTGAPISAAAVAPSHVQLLPPHVEFRHQTDSAAAMRGRKVLVATFTMSCVRTIAITRAARTAQAYGWMCRDTLAVLAYVRHHDAASY